MSTGRTRWTWGRRKKMPTYFPLSYGLQNALKNCILNLNLLRKVKEIEKGVWFSFLAIGMSGWNRGRISSFIGVFGSFVGAAAVEMGNVVAVKAEKNGKPFVWPRRQRTILK